jgi:hypothetical protein
MWIVTVAITLADLTIFAMNKEFTTLIDRRLAAIGDRFALCIKYTGYALCTFRTDSPPFWMGHNMLVATISHDFSPI